jgi:hypothetical protein
MAVYSYSPASEILDYFRNVAQKYELYKYVKLSHKIVGAIWDEVKGIWDLKVEDLTNGNIIEDWCHFLINGSGVLKHVCRFYGGYHPANSFAATGNGQTYQGYIRLRVSSFIAPLGIPNSR